MLNYFACQGGFYETDTWVSECWINVICPTTDDLSLLKDKFDVPVSFLNDIEDNEERPRIEHEDGWRLVILRVPFKTEDNDNPFITVPMGIITKGDLFISVCHYDVEMLHDFVLFSRRKLYFGKKREDLLLHLMLSSAVWFMKYLKQVSVQIKQGEDELEKSVRNEELHRLMKLERTLVYFITSIRGNEILMIKLKSMFKQADIEYDTDLLEDVEIEIQQAHSSANIYSHILSSMMDTFASIISNNLNIVMKRLTSISIILMIPTLIASFYGMNVPNGIEASVTGFMGIVVVSLLLSVMALFFFKKRKWL
ncbi:MAG: magnesium transporter CorA family protein [Bacteroidales bacterium]